MSSAGSSRGARVILQGIGTVLVALFVMSVTLQSAERIPGHGPSPFLCIFGCGNEGMRDFISNIILFIPLGWVVSYWLPSRLALVVCILATVGIESAQWLLLSGRDASIRDILTNAAGGWIGIWLFHHWEMIRFPSRTAGRRLGACAGGAWLVTLAISGWGVRPAPTSAPWFGQWAGELEQYGKYTGDIRQITVGSWVPPLGPIAEPQPLRQGLARDSVTVEIVTVSGPQPGRTSLIFAVFDDASFEQIFVGQAHDRLQFQLLTRFEQWEFRGLKARLPHFPGAEPGDTVHISARVTPGAWTLIARSGAASDSVRLPLTMGLGWNALDPLGWPIYDEWMTMNAFWLAALIAPAAYWLLRVDPRSALWLGGPVVGLTLALLPRLIGIGATTRYEWAGTLAGIAVSGMLAVWTRRRHPVTG